MADTDSTKQCPDCAETVLKEARVCKHCGYRFDEAPPPAPSELLSSASPTATQPLADGPPSPVPPAPPSIRRVPGWLAPVGFLVLALAIVLDAFASPFLLLAVVPLVLGILLTIGRRTAVGVTMIVLALVLPIPGVILLRAVAVKPYRIPAASMEPTLQVGDRVLVNRTGIGGAGIGDIVVFHPPKDAEQQVCGPTPHMVTPGGAACSVPEPEASSLDFIKRIVAGPGDTIYIKEGHAYVNGKRESDPYITPCGGGSECNFPTPIKIPPGDWFMLGDNRGESDDSRFWGPVPDSWIVGVAFMRVSPFSRAGFL